MKDDLERFAWRVRECPDVSPLHRSVALELIRLAGFLGLSFHVEHEPLRHVARIGNRSTYFRVIRELHDWGLIDYRTERRGGLGSSNRVTLLTGPRSAGAGGALSPTSGTQARA